MTLAHANNFSTTLNGSITNSATSMTLTSVTGAPTVGSGVVVNFTITDGTNYEIVQATSLTSLTYTIVRAQESTTAQAWSSGATVEINSTALSFDSKLDKPTSLANYALIAGPASAGGVTQQIGNSATAGYVLTYVSSTALPTWQAPGAPGTITVPGGGTGLTALSTYQLMAGGTTTTGNMQQISNGTSGYVLMSNGSGALPSFGTLSGLANCSPSSTGSIIYANGTSWQTLATSGSSTRYLSNQGTSNAPSWSQINLSNGVTNTLPVANGGTGLASTTAYAVVCGGTTSTGNLQQVASVGTSGAYLVSGGSGVLPSYKGGLTAFRAYASTAQSIAQSTFVKIQYDTESFDTGNMYDNTTNYRFTPTIAGKYLIVAQLSYNNNQFGSQQVVVFCIYKNGSNVGETFTYSTTNGYVGLFVSGIIDMNGSTDYIEMYTNQGSTGSMTLLSGSPYNYFSGVLLQAT